MKIWSVEDGQVIKDIAHNETITCVAYSADSQCVVTGSTDMSLKVWQVVSGKLTQVISFHASMVISWPFWAIISKNTYDKFKVFCTIIQTIFEITFSYPALLLLLSSSFPGLKPWPWLISSVTIYKCTYILVHVCIAFSSVCGCCFLLLWWWGMCQGGLPVQGVIGGRWSF